MELGMATIWGTLSQAGAVKPSHTWFVFASDRARIAQTLSDVGGIDLHIHDGTPQGVFREMGNAFVGSDRSVEHMKLLFQALETALPGIMSKRGARSPFTSSIFSDLRVLAADLTRRIPP
jgi:hypothetical protein